MSRVYAKFLYHMEEMIHKQYEISSTIKHKGEKGRQREDGLAQFLKDNLPDKYGVGTGEIFPSDGKSVSPQCDIIIYDRVNIPIIGKSSAVQQVPIEGVYAVIEVKSILDKASLDDAKQKFEAIRNLPKCEPMIPLYPNEKRGPKFYLFGYKLKTSTKRCTSFIEANSIDDDISIYALDTGGSLWVEMDEDDLLSKRIVFLTTTAKREGMPNIYHTLGLFFVDLLSTLDEITLGKVEFTKMLQPLKYNVDDLLGLSKDV